VAGPPAVAAAASVAHPVLAALEHKRARLRFLGTVCALHHVRALFPLRSMSTQQSEIRCNKQRRVGGRRYALSC
jgi:hypothetical protein